MKILKLIAISLLAIPFAQAHELDENEVLGKTKNIQLYKFNREELEILVKYLLIENDKNELEKLKVRFELNNGSDASEYEEIDIDALERNLQRDDATRTSR